MKKRLLIPIDFSPYSEVLLRTAGVWSDALNADVIVLHQMPGRAPALADNHSRRQILDVERKEAELQIEDLLDTCMPQCDRVKYRVSERNLVHVLTEMYNSNEYNDLIMLGLKGTGLLKQVLMGSMATRIIEELGHATVAVPLRGDAFRPTELLVGVTYRHPINEDALREVLAWFGDFIGKVRFFTVVLPDDDYTAATDHAHGLGKRFGGEVQIFTGTDAFATVRSHLAQRPDAMLVVQRGSRALTDRLFRSFLINSLVHEGSTPLMVIP